MPLILNGSTGISGIDGSAGTPSYQGTDSDTGLWYPAANTVALSTSGSERLRIDSSGRVGIGTSTPLQFNTTGSSSARLLTVYNSGTDSANRGEIQIGNAGTADGTFTGGINFGCGASTTTNNVVAGIYSVLTASSTSTATGGLSFYTSNAGVGAERMRIDSSGNVGIGTSTPDIYSTGLARQFTVSTTTTNGYAVGTFAGGANVSGGVEFGNQTIRHSGIYGLDGSGVSLWTNATNSGSGLTERMRITAAGEVCVNATSAYGSARFYVNAPQPTAANWWVSTLRTASTSIATTMIAFIDGSNDFCGQVYIDPPSNSTVFSTSSDYRLKDNVAPMTGALAKVQALNPVTYTWKKSGKTGQGFIAHELQEIVPECVVGEKDAMRTYIDEEGNEQTAILPQMVDTSFLVATLTAAIKEQQAMIEELKAEVAALKASH